MSTPENGTTDEFPVDDEAVVADFAEVDEQGDEQADVRDDDQHRINMKARRQGSGLKSVLKMLMANSALDRGRRRPWGQPIP